MPQPRRCLSVSTRMADRHTSKCLAPRRRQPARSTCNPKPTLAPLGGISMESEWHRSANRRPTQVRRRHVLSSCKHCWPSRTPLQLPQRRQTEQAVARHRRQRSRSYLPRRFGLWTMGSATSGSWTSMERDTRRSLSRALIRHESRMQPDRWSPSVAMMVSATSAATSAGLRFVARNRLRRRD